MYYINLKSYVCVCVCRLIYSNKFALHISFIGRGYKVNTLKPDNLKAGGRPASGQASIHSGARIAQVSSQCNNSFLKGGGGMPDRSSK